MVCLIAVSFFGVRVANILVAQAGTLPANSDSGLNTPVQIGSFIEMNGDGTDIFLDVASMNTNRGDETVNRFMENLTGDTASVADTYYSGVGGLTVAVE